MKQYSYAETAAAAKLSKKYLRPARLLLEFTTGLLPDESIRRIEDEITGDFMIDINELLLRSNEMASNVKDRQLIFNTSKVIKLHAEYLGLKQSLESLQASANTLAKTMARAESQQQDQLLAEARDTKELISRAKKEADAARLRYSAVLKELPNWKSPDVPAGKTDADNTIIRTYGARPSFEFKPRDHVEIGETLGLLDFQAGAKVAGAKFYFLKGQAVLLQHAIKSFVMHKCMEAGFVPLITPDLAYNHILEGVGFSPRGEESNTYQLEGMDKSLIATAEICVGGMHADEVIDVDRLPLCYVAESHCFRREAGAAGRSSRGLYRVHQFEKLELFVFCAPEESEAQHERILELQESIYQDLGLPYQVVLNCSGDLGAPAYKKYDIEAWMPGKDQGAYGEVTSASNCTDYQARRMNIRYRSTPSAKPRHVHTLNGTDVALGRTMLAIMENFQQPEGGFRVPEVLCRYLGFNRIE